MAQSRKTPLPPLEAEDACVMMHTALRKCCDSKITTAAYSLIHLISNRPPEFNAWTMLGGLVAEGLVKRGTHVAVSDGIGKLEDVFLAAVLKAKSEDRMVPEGARQAMYALLYTLRCFDEGDLAGMAVYLRDEP